MPIPVVFLCRGLAVCKVLLRALRRRLFFRRRSASVDRPLFSGGPSPAFPNKGERARRIPIRRTRSV